MSDRRNGGDWISYPEAQERIHAGLPVEVHDPMAKDWRVARFSSHVPLRHYRIPQASGPTTIDASLVEGGSTVRVFGPTGVQVDVVDVPPGTWRLVFRRES